MAERVAIVTGASSGIGREAARGLARAGMTVVMGCRSLERGGTARDDVLRDLPGADLRPMALDLASLASVRTFASEFERQFDSLDVLVNNAGVFSSRRSVTVDGFEETFAVNHLGHFLLTNLLLGRLKAGAPARIVNVASEAHRAGTIDFDDLQGERRWSGLKAYCQSKLANILHAGELARRLAGTGVAANAMHPGSVRTQWARGQGWMGLVMLLGAPFMIPPSRGADTIVYLSTSTWEKNTAGKYFIKRRAVEPTREARDADVARRLWEESERLVGGGGS